MPIKNVRSLYQPKSCFDGAGASLPTTWSNVDKTANAGLDATKLIVTAAGGLCSLRTFSSISTTDKKYFEIVNTSDSNNDNEFGLANATYSMATNLTGTTNSVGINPTSGVIFINFSNKGACGTFTAGDVLGFEVDGVNKTLKVRVNTGALSSAADISALTFPLFPCLFFSHFGNVGTARFSSASWLNTPTSGFSQIT